MNVVHMNHETIRIHTEKKHGARSVFGVSNRPFKMLTRKVGETRAAALSRSLHS